MVKECVILSGSPVFYAEGINPDAYWIVCDAGYRHCKALGRKPDLLLGDFDSYTEPLPEDVQIIRAPAEKDDTDTMLAIRTAIDMGMNRISIYGGTGARFDHYLANVQAAAFAARHGALCSIHDRDTDIFAFQNTSLQLKQRDGWSISVFAMGEAFGVTLRGLKYPLTDAHISDSFPIGVSNEFAAPEASISVTDGVLLTILCRK